MKTESQRIARAVRLALMGGCALAGGAVPALVQAQTEPAGKESVTELQTVTVTGSSAHVPAAR